MLKLSVVRPPVAGWSSPVARQAHNLKVVGSNPTPATRSHAAIVVTRRPFWAVFCVRSIGKLGVWPSAAVRFIFMVSPDRR
jgi:hypothetical protein